LFVRREELAMSGQLFPPKASVGMVYFLQVLRLYAHPIRIGETS